MDDITGMSDPELLAESQRIRDEVDALTDRFVAVSVELTRRERLCLT